MPNSSLDSFHCARGVVEKLNLEDATANRLKSLGLFEGQVIEVARRGNPLILKAAGSRIAIASELAKNIFVREPEE